jgi:predicted TIM-barrel fold metal-dependent hydrolase
VSGTPAKALPRLPVRPEWLALRREETLAPELPIVDAHHHLWDLPGSRYLFPEFFADIASGHDIRATVFMQSHSMYRTLGDPALRPVGETEFASSVAEMGVSGTYGRCHVCAGIVGEADLRLGRRVVPVLEAHVEAGRGRFRGVRQLAHWHADPTASGPGNTEPSLLLDRSFREGFAYLERLGLSFDVWLYHTQLGEVCDLAGAFSDTTIVLDHAGGPIGIGPYAGRRDEVFAEWSAAMRRLSQHRKVHVKLGGLGMRMFGFEFHEQPQPPSSEQLAVAWRPYVETCIELFGADRCMFESNAPVDKGTCSYHVLWNAFKRLTAACSPSERSALFGGTAARVYRLPAAMP